MKLLRPWSPVTLVAVAVLATTATPAVAQLSEPLDSATLAAFRWRSIGPTNMSGRITDVEGLPSPSKTFYVASAAGGIWKTTNNGITFRPLFQHQRVVAMGDLAIAPSDTMQVWAGTGEEDSRNSISPGGGVYKSVDGGLTWELEGLVNTQAIGRIVVHPTNPDIVYVAALGHIWDANPERGLYRTTDGGDTWERVKFVSDSAGFVDVILDPRNPDLVWAASWQRVRGPWFLDSGGPGSALWKSTDGGDTWTEVEGNGFPTAMKGRIGLAISASNPDIMYAMVEAEEEPDGSGGTGLYRSVDGGVTWTKRNDVNNRPFYYSQVRVDPEDPDRIYFSSTPLQVSTDGGETYGTTTNDIHVDDHAMWIDPADPDRVVVGNDGGVAISWDKGGNWRYLNTFAIGQFYHVSYNMDTPYRVCGGLQDNGTWCGPSRVERGTNKYWWASISGGDGFWSAQDPEDPDIVWSESQGGSMGRSNLATGERSSVGRPDWEDAWRPLQDSIVVLEEQGASEDDPRVVALRERATADSADLQLRYNWSTPLLLSPHDRNVFYAGANRVLKSTDRGDHLVPISPDLTYADPEKIEVSTETTGGITNDATGAETHATIVALDESPLRPGWLYVGTDDGRVWTTRDDGAHWTELTDRFPGVPHGTWVSRVEPSNHDPDRFYVAFDGHRTNDFTPYVFVTDDDGETFRSIAEGLPTGAPDFVHVVREDPHNPDLLFVGTDVGAYVSTDRGRSWQRFMTGLPTVPVHDLEIQPRDRELIAATHGRSIWIVNIAPLEGLTDRVVADGAALFQPPPAAQWGRGPRGGESYGQAWFERPTPGSEARISYWIGPEVAGVLASETATQEGEPAPPGPDGGARRFVQENPRVNVELTVNGPDGEVFQTLTGPGSAGLHTVTWNFRGEASDPDPLSPSERRDSLRIAQRAIEVRDSLIAAGWEEEPLRTQIGVYTGEAEPEAFFGRRGGGRFGGGAARDPEAFEERPGESLPGPGAGGRGAARGGSDYETRRLLSDLITPGRRGFGFGRSGGQAPVAEPGDYTVTLKLGERTFTRTLRVTRAEGYEASAGYGYVQDAGEGGPSPRD